MLSRKEKSEEKSMKMKAELEDSDIFIYEEMAPDLANSLLLGKVRLLQNNPKSSDRIKQLEENGGALWMIRDSRTKGLLTVQSVSYDKASSSWKANEPRRYMLSKNSGWLINNSAPGGAHFKKVATDAGGMIPLTEENATPELPGLLATLAKEGFTVENRVNPKIGEETKTIGYSGYHCLYQLPKKSGEASLQPTTVSLPEGILMALSCPITMEITGKAALMVDPVTLVSNGITYERESLEDKYGKSLVAGVDFYPNIKIKTIINYVSATTLAPEEYLAKLAKIEEDITDPITLEVMENPVLSPSGVSYEHDSIKKWIETKKELFAPVHDPITKDVITGKTLVKNINLKNFIKAWPEFYEQQKAKHAPSSLAP